MKAIIEIQYACIEDKNDPTYRKFESLDEAQEHYDIIEYGDCEAFVDNSFRASLDPAYLVTLLVEDNEEYQLIESKEITA